MAPIEVSAADYEVMASILKDGVAARRSFTFKQLFETLQNIGFSAETNGRYGYNGKMMFVFKGRDKGRSVVSYRRQDDLKQQMEALWGWTKGSFVERPQL